MLAQSSSTPAQAHPGSTSARARRATPTGYARDSRGAASYRQAGQLPTGEIQSTLCFSPYRPLLRDSMASEVAASGAGAEQSPSRGPEVKAHAATRTGIEAVVAPYGLSSSSHHDSQSRGWISACRSTFLKSRP
jgi:hypothetical protein